MSHEKMSTEDAFQAADKLLDNIGNTLEKFIGGAVGISSSETSASMESPSLYSRFSGVGTGTTTSTTPISVKEKQMQFADNLVLVRGAQQEIRDTLETRLEVGISDSSSAALR